MTPRLPPCHNWKENRLNRRAAEMRARNLYSGAGSGAQRKAILRRKGILMRTDEDASLLSDLAELEALGLIQRFRDREGETRYAVVWQAIFLEPQVVELPDPEPDSSDEAPAAWRQARRASREMATILKDTRP